MKERTYVLTWNARDKSGAFCPSGGLTRAEAEEAEWRLRQAAKAAAGPNQAPGSTGGILNVRLLPYYFDVAEAFAAET